MASFFVPALCCIASAQRHDPLASVDAFDRALVARVGITLEAAAPACRVSSAEHARDVTFELPGFCVSKHVVRQSAGESRLHFAPLVELGALAGSAAACATCGWNGATEETAVRTLGFAVPPAVWKPDVLRLVQESGTAHATGVLELASSGAVLHVANVRSGCGMVHDPAGAFDIDGDPLLLTSRIDLHNLMREENLCLSLLLADGGRVGIPFDLDIPEPPFTVGEAGTFESNPEHPSTLTLTANRASFASVSIKRIPACIEIVRWDARPERVELLIITTPAARQPHACSPIRGTISLDGDPVRFAFNATPVHEAALTDADDRALVDGVFVPGETLWLAWDAAGQLRHACPQRLAATSPLWGFDAAATTKWSVPTDVSGALDVIVRSTAGDHAVHVTGHVSSDVAARHGRWLELCK